MFDYIKTISPAQYKKHNVEKEPKGMRKKIIHNQKTFFLQNLLGVNTKLYKLRSIKNLMSTWPKGLMDNNHN